VLHWYSQHIIEIYIMTTAYMPRQKRPTTARSIRLIDEIAVAVDNYADDQLISSNSAVNKLLRDRLTDLGYIPDDKNKAV